MENGGGGACNGRGTEDAVSPHSPRAGLKRTLTAFDGVSMVLGVVVGSGLFATPGVVLTDAGGSPVVALVLWLVAGGVGYACCEVYAELGSFIPHAGGDGEYIQVAFGELASFVFMWMFFFVSTGGAMAILVVTFARYAVALIPGAPPVADAELWVQVAGALCVLVLTAINCMGVEAGTLVQNLLSFSKALLIAVIIAAAPLFILVSPAGAAVVAQNFNLPVPRLADVDWSRMGAGLVAAIWAFDGWNCLGFLSEELKDPKRDLPKSLSIGMILAVAICLSANVSYLCILPVSVIGTSQVVAVDAVAAAADGVMGAAAPAAAAGGVGAHMGRLVALLVALNVLGSANGTMLCNARYFYAMAREGKLPRIFGAVTAAGAPYAALSLIGAWTLILLFLAANQLEKLIDYFGIATWIFYGAVGAAQVKLRWDFPDAPRPYEARLYPLPPILVVVTAVFLVVSSLVAHPIPSVASLAFVFIAFPLFYIQRWMRSEAQPQNMSKRSLQEPLLQ